MKTTIFASSAMIAESVSPFSWWAWILIGLTGLVLLVGESNKMI